MSGGHWNYLSTRIQEQAEGIPGIFEFLAIVEHEMDWALCGDTCAECTKLRLWEAMVQFFTDYGGDQNRAIVIMRGVLVNFDRDLEHACSRCKELYKTET